MSVFDSLHPKTSFWAGYLGGIGTIATIGFLVLLAVVVRGGSFTGEGGAVLGAALPSNRNVNAAATTPTPEPDTQPAGQVKPVDKDDHVLGDVAKAKVVMIEYSDLECPFCKRFHPTMQQASKEYGSQVAWVWRHFPLSFHQNAQKEAEASECAAELGGNKAFWKYIDLIMERTAAGGTGFALDALVPLAKEIGLNEAKFKSCLDGNKYAQKVRDQMASGEAAGVTGTPGTILLTRDGKSQLVPGALPYASLKQAIDGILQ